MVLYFSSRKLFIYNIDSRGVYIVVVIIISNYINFKLKIVEVKRLTIILVIST